MATALLVFSLAFVVPNRAEIPEPDNVVYGLITLGTSPVTAANTNVVVEARKSATGPVVASYRIGENPAYGDAYSLEIPLEAFFPLANTNASRVGALVYLSLRDASGVRDTRTLAIAQRGQLVRLDFAEPDSDGDRLPDQWETRYFGNASGADPMADPDRDGRNNLQEYIDGTDPLVADGRHPADRSPADNVLAMEESEAYSLAWLLGASWPGHSNGIPISYVSRAATLALAATPYVFTNVPPTNAPMWWVNLPYTGPRARGANVAEGLPLPANAAPGVVLPVTLRIVPTNSVTAYAVQDRLPEGWTNVLNISHGGFLDASQGMVKWGPFLDNGARELTCDLVPPAQAPGPRSLQGIASFDGDDVIVAGTRSIVLSAGVVLAWNEARIDGVGLVFTLAGAPASGYVIEASTDLKTWVPADTIMTDANGHYDFRPSDVSSSQQRFYRARLAEH